MSQDTTVKLIELCKDFSSIKALDHVSLEARGGDVIALLGSNGSGKTTLFRHLINVYKPSAGLAKVLGKNSDSLDGSDFEKIGYISEGQKLPLWMKAKDYIQYCSEQYSDWDDDFCSTWIERFDLPTENKLKFLSRGQLMKVALMSILPAHPKLLLLDEPFSGLDVETRAQLSFLLKTLSKEGDLTTMITTHDVEEVEGFASRLCLLKKGKLDLDVELSIFMNSYRILKRPVSMMESEHSSLLESAVGWPIDDSNVSWMLKDFNADLMSEIMTADDRFEENHFQKATLRDILTFRAVVK